MLCITFKVFSFLKIILQRMTNVLLDNVCSISGSRARLPCGCCSDLVPRDINNQPTNQPAMIILRKGGAAGDVFPSSSREGGSDPDIPFSSNQITPSSLYPLHPTLLTQGAAEGLGKGNLVVFIEILCIILFWLSS